MTDLGPSGGPDAARFVQIMNGQVSDPDRAQQLMADETDMRAPGRTSSVPRPGPKRRDGGLTRTATVTLGALTGAVDESTGSVNVTPPTRPPRRRHRSPSRCHAGVTKRRPFGCSGWLTKRHFLRGDHRKAGGLVPDGDLTVQ